MAPKATLKPLYAVVLDLRRRYIAPWKNCETSAKGVSMRPELYAVWVSIFAKPGLPEPPGSVSDRQL